MNTSTCSTVHKAYSIHHAKRCEENVTDEEKGARGSWSIADANKERVVKKSKVLDERSVIF